MPNRGKGKAAKAKIPAPKSRDPRADSGSERDGSTMRRGLSDKADVTSTFSLRYHHYEEYESWPNGALCSLTAYALSSCAGLCKKALSYRTKTVWLGDTAHPPLCPRSTCMGQVPLHAHHGQLSRAQDVWPVHRLVFALRPTPPNKLRYGSRQSK